MPVPTPVGYSEWLASLKAEIRQARLRASSAVNAELMTLYWRIGHDILDRQARQGWGARIIDRLAADLRTDFPEMKGLSPRNLKYMRAFAEAWPEPEIVQQVVARLPWGQNIDLLDKVKERDVRLWYARAAIENGWSRNVLAIQIGSRLHERQGRAVTNFHRTLPAPQSELAGQLLKDPYQFDFLSIAEDAHERQLEAALTERVQKLLLEMGKGFAFIGRQYRLEVGGQDFFVDLLFYHRRLRCLIAVDLKMDEFKPSYVGQMTFYLTALDEIEKHTDDNPSIGLILCRDRNRVVVEYALRDVHKPVGVAKYEVNVVGALPPQLLGALPTADEIEAGIGDAFPALDDTHDHPDAARHNGSGSDG